MIKKKLELLAVSQINQIAFSNLDLEKNLSRIAEITSTLMQADACSIYLMDKSRETLILRATRGLDPSSVGKVRLKIGEGLTGWTAKLRESVAVRDVFSDPHFLYLPETKEEQFKSMLTAPIIDGDDILGVINVQTMRKKDYYPEETRLLSFISRQLAGMIRNGRLFEEANVRLKELTTLLDTATMMNSSLDLDSVLVYIVKAVVEHSKATGCFLTLIDRETDRLQIKASEGFSGEIYNNISSLLTEPRRCRAIIEGKPFLLNHPKESHCFKSIDQLSAVLCIPLIVKGTSLGTLCLFGVYSDSSKERETFFTEDDLRLGSIMANQAAIAIENASLYKQSQKLAADREARIQELSILYEVGNAMRTTIDLEKLLYIILMGITHGKALGFNRAFLFLVDDKDEILLKGSLAVGPRDAEDANKIWRELESQSLSFFETISSIDWSIIRKEDYLTELVKNIEIPLIPDAGVLALSVLEKKSYHITPDLYHLVNLATKEKLSLEEFATVPLIAKDRVLGVILVDNLFNKQPITHEKIKFLSTMANQAGLAVESARLYSRLEEIVHELKETQDRLIHSAKLAALGELIANIAHEIRNPLVAIGGFSRRLRNMVNDDEDSRRYTEIIMNEVEKLEKRLMEILRLSRMPQPKFTTVEINELISEILAFMKEDFEKRNIKQEVILQPALPDIKGDVELLRQVFFNIFFNAIEAMMDGGTLRVVSNLTIRENFLAEDRPGSKLSLFEDFQQASSGRRDFVEIQVSDTGGGIPQELLNNIFNPFFTTKNGGSGLGLTVAYKAINEHGGNIDVINRPGEGATFIILLPAAV